MCRVGDGAHGGGAALVVNVSDGLSAHIQHQRINQLDIVAVARLIGHLCRGGDRQESSGRAKTHQRKQTKTKTNKQTNFSQYIHTLTIRHQDKSSSSTHDKNKRALAQRVKI